MEGDSRDEIQEERPNEKRQRGEIEKRDRGRYKGKDRGSDKGKRQEEKLRERDKREEREGKDRGRETRCERQRAYTVCRHSARHRAVETQEGETEERRNSGREGGRQRWNKVERA
jgi:hypothetical protein